MLEVLRKDVQKAADPKKAQFLGRFFKTAKDQYAAGDKFLGLTVPQSRLIAKKYRSLPLADCLKLLTSAWHEERLIALIIMTYQFKKGDDALRKKIYEAYLANTKFINNWDLVDLSAGYIVGEYLWHRCHAEFSSASSSQKKILKQVQDDRSVLIKLAKSQDLWEKRISIIATFAFIYKGEYEWTFKIADILLHDKHDLIHKAVGWMLREVGKRVSQDEEEKFLKTRYKTMPRTMLRYAIEKFEEGKRKKYLAGTI